MASRAEEASERMESHRKEGKCGWDEEGEVGMG